MTALTTRSSPASSTAPSTATISTSAAQTPLPRAVVVVPMTVSMSMLPVPRRRRRLPAHRPSRRVPFVLRLFVVVVVGLVLFSNMNECQETHSRLPAVVHRAMTLVVMGEIIVSTLSDGFTG